MGNYFHFDLSKDILNKFVVFLTPLKTRVVCKLCDYKTPAAWGLLGWKGVADHKYGD